MNAAALQVYFYLRFVYFHEWALSFKNDKTDSIIFHEIYPLNYNIASLLVYMYEQVSNILAARHFKQIEMPGCCYKLPGLYEHLCFSFLYLVSTMWFFNISFTMWVFQLSKNSEKGLHIP